MTNTGNEPEKHRCSSRCPKCNKLLTKPMVKIEAKNFLTPEQVRDYRQGFRIYYGAQTKCRNCKKLRETLEIASIADFVGPEAQDVK